MRLFLTEFMLLNPSQFTFFCHPKSVSAHVCDMKKNSIWGTQAEIVALAISFRKPVYTAVHRCIDDNNSNYYWAKYDREPQHDLVFPPCTPSLNEINQDVGHLEICLDSQHYDVVVMTDGSTPCQPPFIADTSTSDVISID